MEVKENHKRDEFGRLKDSVRTDPMRSTDRKIYTMAALDIGNATAPRMFDSKNPHARLFVANFDGTGNDLDGDPGHSTNVAKIHQMIAAESFREPRIKSEYVEGAGTQDGVIERTIDGATGRTYGDRLERMYSKFIKQANDWVADDPKSDIRLIATGFSRGAEQAAGFLRLVNERGIQDPRGRSVADGPSTAWTLPPLRAPGKTLTTEILFDPVGTGTPNNYNRQPTSSTVSALQITARDERRNAFPSTQILPPGRSADGRFVGVTVPGAHSDIGGSYHQNGLSTLNFNMAADFLNAHSDVPLVSRLPEPTDPSMYVIHHSEDHMWFYSTSEFRRDGHRDIMGSQASPPHCREEREVIACAPPDPFDPALAAMVGPRYPVGIHSDSRGVPAEAELRDPGHPHHAMYRSASVQLLELHARSGFDLKDDQLDRLATGLVTEARKQGLTEIGDVQFGEDHGPHRPNLIAFQTYPGNVDRPDSRTASIDAVKVLETPAEPARQPAEIGQNPTETSVTPPIADHSASPTLPTRTGSEDIRSLQENLNKLGVRDMSGNSLETHGVYDIATSTAVARFQSTNALPVTGVVDDPTRTTITGQAFIAELQHPRGETIVAPRHATEPGARSPDTSERSQAPLPPSWSALSNASDHDAGQRRSVMSRTDPRHPESPGHDLYAELQRCLPDASEDRLLQFTAVCHRNRITASNLSNVHLNHDTLKLSFDSEDPRAMPATVDLNAPPPEAEKSVQQIQQVDQQREQDMQQTQQQAQHQSAEMAPAM